MVFTHLPSNVLLILVPFMPSLPLAAIVLFARFAISQMDVPTRQSYTIAIVEPDERSAAAGVTGIARSLGVAASPLIAAPLLVGSAFIGAPFVISGALKIVYDLLLYRSFRALRPPEEATLPAAARPGRRRALIVSRARPGRRPSPAAPRSRPGAGRAPVPRRRGRCAGEAVPGAVGRGLPPVRRRGTSRLARMLARAPMIPTPASITNTAVARPIDVTGKRSP